MASKLTPAQAESAREELGIEQGVAPVRELNAPAPRAATPTAAQIEATRQEEARGPEHSLGDEWSAAFRVDNTVGRVLSKDDYEYPVDLNFDAVEFTKQNQPRIDALGPMADREEVARELGQAWSDAHADSLLRQMEQDRDDEALLAAGGGSALLARLGAAFSDPVDLSIALATGGTAGALTKGGKFGKIITSALTAGTASGGTEALLSSDNVFRDETDVAFAALAGLTIGGALGSLSRAENQKIVDLANEAAGDTLDTAGARMTDDSVGAARAKPESRRPNAPLFADADEALAAMEAPEFRFKTMNNALFNLQSKLFFSESDSVRKAASAIFEGGFLKNKGKTRISTVENRANMLDAVFQRNVYADTLSDFKGWAKRNNHGAVRREMTTGVGEKFYSEVGLAMRGITTDLSPEALSAARKIRTHMDNIHKMAQRAGVEGFDEGGMLDDYFPRVLNKSKFQEARVKYNDEALETFYANSMRKANPDMPEELIGKTAKAYVRIMREKVAGIEDDLLHGIRLDDIDRLRSGWDGQPPKEVLDLIDSLERLKAAENADRGRLSFAKHRIRFAEDHSEEMVVNGEVVGRLNFTDLYENDARLVLTRYSRAMNGHIAMAEKMGVKSRMDFERLTKELASDVEMKGGDARAMEQAFRDGYDLMLGQPIDRWNPNGDAQQLSRVFSAYNYAGRGGQFGVNALAELGNTVAMGGFRAALRVFPDMKAVMKRAANGELEHPLARFVELNFAPGVNTLITPAVRNLDELNEGFGGKSIISKFAATVDPYLKSMGRQTSIASGLGPITDATQRVSAVRHLERMAKWATGKGPSEAQRARLRASGLDNEMQDRIFAMLRPAKTVEETVSEAPVLRTLDDTTPEVEPGMTRLYRGTSDTQGFDDVFKKGTLTPPDRPGRFFTTDRDSADYYRDAYNANRDARIDYVDVPTSRLEEFRFSPADEFILDIDNVKFDRTVSKSEGGAGKYRKGRLVDIDMDKWTDSEALQAFSESANRVTRDAIQMPDISTSTFLFNHPAGRLVFQFMRFPMDAVNKQLARHLHHMDGESLNAMLSSFAIASTVYMAQQSIEFANDPEERKKRLAPAQIAKIGFMRTGYSSLLPGVMDSALYMAGFDPQFAMGRSSGLTTIFPIANNPSTTLLKNAGTFAAGVTRSSLHDDIQFSQADMRAGLQVLPYYRTLGVKNAWHAIEEQFPESRKQE